jgi:intein/homing endonuclease
MNIIEKIKERDLKQFIESRTGLVFKPVGRWENLSECYFCGGRDCFRLSPDKKGWYCFQCFNGGDIISFRAVSENLTYKEALEIFKIECGLKNVKQPDLEWFLIREDAAEYMKGILFSDLTEYEFAGQKVSPLSYMLNVRKHSVDALMHFRVGFNDGGLINHLKQTYDAKILTASGLLNEKGYSVIPEKVFTFPFIVDGKISYFRLKDPNQQVKFQMPLISRLRDSYWFNQDSLSQTKELWVCLKQREKILTSKGLKEIEKIKINEKVYTHKGNFKPVKETFRRIYQGKIYKIYPQYSCQSLSVTNNHPILVCKKQKCTYPSWHMICSPECKRKNTFSTLTCQTNFEPEWVNAENLDSNFYLIYPINRDELNENELLKIWNNTLILDADFWYLIGLFLGDGTTDKRKPYKVTWSLNLKKDIIILSKVENILKKLKLKSGFYKTKSVVNIYFCNIKVGNFFIKFYNEKNEKYLPTIFEKLPLHLQKELIKGLYDSDGCLHKNKNGDNIRITNTGFDLLFSIQRILLRFNCITGINKCRDFSFSKFPHRQGILFSKPLYNLESTSGKLFEIVNENKIKIKDTRKFGFVIKDSFYLPIRKVETENYSGFVYNVNVKDDNSYCGHLIVTHNCEGENDALSLWDAGVEAVASCGAVTIPAVRWLKKWSYDSIYIAFDNDPAGKNYRDTFIQTNQGSNLFVVDLGDKKDIDDVLREAEIPAGMVDTLKKQATIPSAEFQTNIRQKQDGYYILRTSREIQEVRLTNWTIDLEAIIKSEDDDDVTWKCKLHIGNKEKEVYISAIAFSNLNKMREKLLTLDLLYFQGRENDMTELIKYFGKAYKPKTVIEKHCVGQIEDGFIAENVFIRDNGEILPLINTFLQVDEKHSIKIIPLVTKGGSNSEIPYFNLTEPVGGIEKYKHAVYDLMVKNRNEKVLLAIGWLKAVFWSDEFYKQHRFFPLLCLHGKFQSGKSVQANWLMSMAGLRGSNSELLSDRGTTEVGLARKLSYYSNLPVFADDYRADDSGARFHTFLRGVFDRTSATKGLRDDFGVRRVVIRGGLILTGEHIPPDPALQSRMIAIELTRSERNDATFPQLRHSEPNFNVVGFDWLKSKQRNVARFLAEFDDCREAIQKEIDDPRQAGCLAVAVAAMVTEDFIDKTKLLKVTISLAKSENIERAQDEPLAQLWEAVDVLNQRNEIKPSEIYKDSTYEDSGRKDILYIHLPGLLAKIQGTQFTRHYVLPNKREIVKLLRQEKYVVGGDHKKVNGKNAFRWMLNLKDCPSVLKNCFENDVQE